MEQEGKATLSNGLPALFTDGDSGFERLCNLVGLVNRDQRRAFVASPFVKRVIEPSMSKLPTAERQRVGIRAFFELAETRRDVWRREFRGHEAPNAKKRPFPSIESAALVRYDPEFHTRKWDESTVKKSLVDVLSDATDSLAEVATWQKPALGIWPEVREEIVNWTDLPAERRELVTIVVFVVATILDDARFLQWAADRVDGLAEEFNSLLPAPPGADVIRQWKETCEAIVADARNLAGEPPQPQHLPELRRNVNRLDSLRESVVEILERADPAKLLARIESVVAERIGRCADPLIANSTEQMAAQWRLAYPIDGDVNAEGLRVDVERAEQELPEALQSWTDKKRHKDDLTEQLHNVTRQKETARSPRDVIDAESREDELYRQMGTAGKAVQTARERVFSVVAPSGQPFDPTRDYAAEHKARGGHTGPDTPEPPPDGGLAPPAQTVNADGDSVTSADGGDSRDKAAAGADNAGSAGAGHDGLQDAVPGTSAGDRTSESHDGTDESPAKEAETKTIEGKQAENEGDGYRLEAATTALWNTLGSGRPGIAYHIARLLDDEGRGGPSTPPPDIIAASVLAPHVKSADSRVVGKIRPIMERVDPEDLLRRSREDDDRDAISLLLFSAALRPALLAPSTGAASLLRRVSMSESLAPAYELAKVVADHADRLQGVQLDASMLQATVAGTWPQAFESFVRRAQSWHDRAKAKRNLFGRADRVWREMLDRGCLAELVRIMSDSRDEDRRSVEEIRKQISDRKAFNNLVQRTDRQGRRGDKIQGLALKQIWNDVQPAVQLANEWMRLVGARPRATDFVGQRVTELRQDLNRRGPDVLAAFDRSAAGGSAEARIAASACARQAVQGLQELFDGKTPVPETDLNPDVILSRDLLFITRLKVDANCSPVPSGRDDLLDLLMETGAHAHSACDAFDARLAEKDLVGARLALDLVEAGDEKGRDGRRESLLEEVAGRQQQLRKELASAEERLERAFCRGQIDTDGRNDMAAELSALRPSVSLPSVNFTLDDVDIIAGAFSKLDESDRRIKESCENAVKRTRDRLSSVPADRLDADAKSVVESAIDGGYILSASEQIARLEKGESATPPPEADDPFEEFMQAVSFIERSREATEISGSAILSRVANRETFAGVSFADLADDAARQAKGLLEAWYKLAKAGRIETNRLRDLLQHLGFKVLDISTGRSGHGWPGAEVKTEPVADRAWCPARQFGSEAAGRYRILLNWELPAAESILRSIGSTGSVPTVVLHFGCLGADRDKLRALAVQTHRLFLVVDESLILFLAGRPAGRLSAMFRCTLPFSSAEPYAKTSGLVPPELFYGRESERQAVIDQSGACFIYGGRQLGKTALLRRVERDFDRSRKEHVAKWIDLKANDIGYGRAAHDIWPLLQRDLQGLGVIAERRRELDPENRKQVESLLEGIQQWIDHREDRRMLLLLDEADEFLVQDAKTDFRESKRLKGLMDKTERRFKVVFAGLHNVLRTTRQANHPLAHFGDPICIGAMLSNGEWKQAQALVREPLRAVGCRFAREDGGTRILAQTNYYPSLIQLYGDELLRRMRDSRKSFPFTIDDDDIDQAYASSELGSAIRQRFLLTLQLDQRYEVIAYALALELNDGAHLNRGLERGDIADAARAWWPAGFGLQDVEFEMLLHEMEGLGVLRAIGSNRYTLRNPNVLLLLGSSEDIQRALDKKRELPKLYEPASFRAPYPGDPVSRTRRGPLTYQQEAKLRVGGVAVISGCNAGGLEDVEEFVTKRIGAEVLRRLEPVANADEFEEQLRKQRPVPNSVTVHLVPRQAPWDISWLRAARRVLKKKAKGRSMWSRVAFIATPDELWNLLVNATGSDLVDVDWIGLRPCDVTFLRRWLADINLTADADHAEELYQVSCGWPVMLDSFSGKRARKIWQTRIEELRRETRKIPAVRRKELFGLSDEAEDVFRALAGADDPFDRESVELVSGEVGVDAAVVQRRVDWGERLGLLFRVGESAWTMNPLVRRLLDQPGAPE